MLTYLAIANRFRPKWLVWENVPGVLSSNRGRDFGTFLGGLGELGYGFAYRVLDAQYFGVAQRRRRVFVVGYLGDWRRAAAVLFERESMSGNPPPSREKGKGSPGDVAARLRSGSGNPASHNKPSGLEENLIANPLPGHHFRADLDNDTLLPMPHAEISPAIKARDGKGVSSDGDGDGAILVPMVPFDTTQITSKANRSSPKAGDPCHPLAAGDHAPAIAVDYTNLLEGEICGTLEAAQSKGNRGHGTITGMQVRRLTPVECARLQGFPDDYLDITFRGRPAADGNKYKALGNSMATPVIAYIGRQIEKVMEIANGNG